MIEIDKTDFLYKHLTKLGVEDVDKAYLEFARHGISTLKDFKKHIYSLYGDNFYKEIGSGGLDSVVDFYHDVKISKKVSKQELTRLLKEYKVDGDKEKLELIIDTKLKDMIFMGTMYATQIYETLIEDVVQTCNIGLLKAIQKYDPKSRISFDDYVDYWVSEEIKENYSKEENNGKN